MGRMKRAEQRERERLLSTKLKEDYLVLVTWRRNGEYLMLNVLDPETRAPLTKEWRIQDPQIIEDMINRSLSPLRPSPRLITFRQNLEAGRGEIHVSISAEQYRKMRR